MSISVLPKRNIVLPSPDGKDFVRLYKDVIAQVPDWAPKTAYFKALAADEKLLVMTGGKKSRGGRRADEAAEEAEHRDDEESAGSDEVQESQ